MRPLKARVVTATLLTETQISQMYAVFEATYEHVTLHRFCEDLAQKDDVILLIDDRNVVQGFSTMKNLAMVVGGESVYGLFSGDTVVANAHWGQRVLGRAFLKYLFMKKARHPFAPYWWFLISKGYKTYLLMANNFEEYYPSPDRETSPRARRVLDSFGAALYPGEYDPANGVITFEQSHGQLRSGIADISPELLENGRIAFFQQKNPGWSRGTELACIARMTWTMPMHYAFKSWMKTLPPKLARAKPQPMRAPLRSSPAAASAGDGP